MDTLASLLPQEKQEIKEQTSDVRFPPPTGRGGSPLTLPYVPTSVRQSTPLSLVCRAGRRRELDQGLGNGRSGDNHGGSGAERRRAKRGGAERRILHGRAAIVGVWGEGPRS